MGAKTAVTVIATNLVAILLLSGCQGVSQTTATSISDLEYTRAVETIAAELTQKAPQVMPTLLAGAKKTVTPPVLEITETSTIEPEDTLPPTSTPIPSETPPPSDTPTQELSPTPSPTPETTWNLLYEDAMKSGSWIAEETDSYRLQYSHGGYMISSDIKNDIAYSVRSEPYSNVRVEVTAQRVSGPTDGYFGIICHFQNGGNYYFLGIGVDGWYGIGLRQGSQMRFLEEGIDQSGAVRTGDASNNLRADCAGGKLSLWSNDIQLASISDATFEIGKVGLGVGNRSITGMEVVFSDFKVYEPVQP